MYMSQETKKKVLKEAYRVMKPGGIIEIWDVEVPKKHVMTKNILQLN